MPMRIHVVKGFFNSKSCAVSAHTMRSHEYSDDDHLEYFGRMPNASKLMLKAPPLLLYVFVLSLIAPYPH